MGWGGGWAGGLREPLAHLGARGLGVGLAPGAELLCPGGGAARPRAKLSSDNEDWGGGTHTHTLSHGLTHPHPRP